MARPIIGILTNSHMVSDTYEVHGGGAINVQAVAEVTGCLPLLVPADPEHVKVEDLMGRCAGFVFTGGRPNVHPEEYGEQATPAHGTFDRKRDALVLPLIRECLSAGLPILGICRGFQELNVALGGTLYPEIRDLPGRDNHRMPPDGSLEEIFELRHEVAFSEGGVFHRLMGAQKVMTNTLHGQGIKTAGSGVVIDGYAPDGTPEALYVEGAAGFSLSVQWHPEWRASEDPVSRPLFSAFGEAAYAWDRGEMRPALKSA